MGGYFLVGLAILGIIMSERKWIKLICSGYITFVGIIFIIDVIKGRLDTANLIVLVMFALLGMYVYRVKHMFDSRNNEK